MGKYKIIIEGEGSHHSGDHGIDANEGAKSLVVVLKLAGHTVTRAEFIGDKPAEDINVDVPEHATMDAVTGAISDDDSTKGAPATIPSPNGDTDNEPPTP